MLPFQELRRLSWAVVGLLMGGASVAAAAASPEPINPFGPQAAARQAVAGGVYLSDGSVLVGDLHLTAGKRLRVFDAGKKTYVHYALGDLERIEIECVEERIEREWRFKESGSDEKVFTGRTYPRRDFRATLTPRGGRPLPFELADGVPVYLLMAAPPDDAAAADQAGQEPRAAAQRVRKTFLLQPYSKGDAGTTLAGLVYVRRMEFGEAAVAAARKLLAEKAAAASKDGLKPPP